MSNKKPVTAMQDFAQSIHNLADAWEQATRSAVEAMKELAEPLQKAGLIDENLKPTKKGEALLKAAKK